MNLSVSGPGDQHEKGQPVPAGSFLPPAPAITPSPSPLESLSAPVHAIETRLIHLIETRDQESLQQLRETPRTDLLTVLQHSKYFESILTALRELKAPQNEEERLAVQKLIAVDRTPTWAATAKALGMVATGDTTSIYNAFFGRRGPQIWCGYGEKPTSETLMLHSKPLKSWSPLTLESTVSDRRAYTNAVLAMAVDALKGIPEAQLDLVRLAVNLYSEKNGIGYDSRLICRTLDAAFPDQLQYDEYSYAVGRVRLPTKWKRYATKMAKAGQLLAEPGSEAPEPPSGLDRRERHFFHKMMQEFRKEKSLPAES